METKETEENEEITEAEVVAKPQEEVTLMPEEGDSSFFEDDEDSLVDEDEEDEFFEGDFFWIFQKVMWGLLQALVVGFILFLVIWWWGGKLWNNDPEVSETNTQTKQEQEADLKTETEEPGFWSWLTGSGETETISSETEAAPKEEISGVSTVVVQVAPFAKKILVNDSLNWLNATSILGGSVIADVNNTVNNQERIEKIGYLINDSEKILTEAQRINNLWGQLYDSQIQTQNQLEAQIKALDIEMKTRFSTFDPLMNNNIEQLKIYKKAFVQVSQDREVSEMMLKNINNFEATFRQKVLPLFPHPATITPGEQ